jgi:peptidyl-lysine (3S)-dioxygenase / protease
MQLTAKSFLENDNLRDEYEMLYADIPKSIPFARIALGKEPDAINFWLGKFIAYSTNQLTHLTLTGNSRTVTALHKDPYENIYIQIKGKKHFILFPPVAAPCIKEQHLLAATYINVRTETEMGLPDALIATLDSPQKKIPVSLYDPEYPERHATSYSSLISPLHVTLEPTDILYLPALWFHRVSLSCGPEDFSCSVNYW